MKKMLLLLASLACFGLLASCSDETQDVYVTNANNYGGEIAGIMTGTMAVTGDNLSYKIDNTRYAFVSPDGYTDSDVVDYHLTVPYTKTAPNGEVTYDNKSLSIKKINGKYYYDFNDNKTKITDNLEVDGSLEGSFTVKGILKVDDNTTISDLKFEKK